MYCLKFLLLLGLSISIAYVGYAQIPFDSTLVYNQQEKLGRFYSNLMQNAGSIKVVNEEGYNSVIASPTKGLKGEATFIYEVAENGSIIAVYMTEFWCYSLFEGQVTVKDYIVFVDKDDFGFDYDKILQYRLNPISADLIGSLFDYVKKNRTFEMIKPRKKNLKYQRIRFE